MFTPPTTAKRGEPRSAHSYASLEMVHSCLNLARHSLSFPSAWPSLISAETRGKRKLTARYLRFGHPVSFSSQADQPAPFPPPEIMLRTATTMQPASKYSLANAVVATCRADRSVCPPFLSARSQPKPRVLFLSEGYVVCSLRSSKNHLVCHVHWPLALRTRHEDTPKRASAGRRGNAIVIVSCFHAGFAPDIYYVVYSGECRWVTCVGRHHCCCGQMFRQGESWHQPLQWAEASGDTINACSADPLSLAQIQESYARLEFGTAARP